MSDDAKKLQAATRRVISYTACRVGKDDAVIAATAERIVRTGECVWHALAQVTKKPCWCARCRPDVRRFA